MRHVLSTALVALIVGALAGATVSAVAQSPSEPPVNDGAVVTAGLNADTVDGRHAVKATEDNKKRRNRLVAANSDGYLPSNIVMPRWSLIKDMPSGFADGWDDAGITRVYSYRFGGAGTTIAPQQVGSEVAYCPSDGVVTGGGFRKMSGTQFIVLQSLAMADGTGWYVQVLNTGPDNVMFAAEAMCLRTEPMGRVGIIPTRKRK